MPGGYPVAAEVLEGKPDLHGHEQVHHEAGGGGGLRGEGQGARRPGCRLPPALGATQLEPTPVHLIHLTWTY